jgi:hypothetical protein
MKLTANPDALGSAQGGAGRYVPLIAWAIVVLTLMLVAPKIMSTGFLPGGDARRHIGKAYTDKPYSDIIVMRPEYQVDHSPGWEWLLHVLHQKLGWDRDALANFSVISLLLCLFLAPLAWVRRPEAWLAALLAQMLAIPELMVRFTQGRPYLLTEAILICILFSWSRPDPQKPSWPRLALTCIGFCLSAWIHGAWYLWTPVLAAFFLAGAWRSGLWLTGCWALGTIFGAVLTGRPWAFLETAVATLLLVSREQVPSWILVGEYRPSYGEFSTLVLLALVFLWRRSRNQDAPDLLRSPVIVLFLIGWMLGFRADRFWADWGLPAAMVWLAMQFDDILAGIRENTSWGRIAGCGVVAATFFLHSTNDLDRRYSASANASALFLNASDPSLQGWLPGANGIFYSSRTEFFYNTFYQNPRADWRYILGFEPALMPDDDLRILRRIQLNQGALSAHQPWIEKMRPEDRLAIYSPVQPDLPSLEWHRAVGNLWIGRLPSGG